VGQRACLQLLEGMFRYLSFEGGDVRFIVNVCRAMALLCIAVLAACSGGGGSQDSTSVSTNSLSFSASSPDEPTPAAQTFTASVGADAVYVTILGEGAAIANTSYTLSGTTAQIVVTPAAPSSLGAGQFTAAVSVTAYRCGNPDCTTLTPGNSQIVNVTYQIPPIVRFVAPTVATATTAGTAIIRGQGFQKFSVTGVLFGATAATSFTVVSDTQIQASYPAFAAGNYPVQIQASGSPGTIISQANLAVVNAPSYPAATIAYPSAAPQVKHLVYDAQRQALLVAVDSAGGQILRYPFSGGAWGAAATASINSLSDLVLSTDGQHLLALAQTALYQLTPDNTLATVSTTPAPTFATAGTYFKTLAVGNDGNAVVTTGYAGSTSTALYLYAACNPLYTTCNPAFTQPATTPTLDNSTAAGSMDGSLVSIMQGDSALTSAPGVYQYLAASDSFSATGVALNQNSIAPALSVYTPPDSTTSTTRIVLSGTDASNAAVINVYDGSYTLLGTLPATTLAVAVKPDASRAYTFDATLQVLSFDLTANPAGGVFPQVGSGTTLAGDPGTGVKMAISPDGGTLFLAGSTQVVVQPSPP
jgi:hypothetical protein